jgi:hypothetical protein
MTAVRAVRAFAAAACALMASAAACADSPAAGSVRDLAVTYCCHAADLWTTDATGGRWGPGVGDKDGNGGVRGMTNTAAAHAFLAREWDAGRLDGTQQRRLGECGLGRRQLAQRVGDCLAHVCAHHVSASPQLKPRWGHSWQSPLWLGNAAIAAFLIWDDLSSELRASLARVAASEADRIAGIPPGDRKEGDTKAEENAWNLAGPASALALVPEDPRAAEWWRVMRSYAVNVYSLPSDRTSTATVGTDRVADLASTTNLFEDRTLENHNFFHPGYLKASGQSLEDAYLILALGDRLHGTRRAAEFLPYGLHNVRTVWERVMKPLVLPGGDLIFPCGNDWTYHCSTHQGYFALMAAAFGDPAALDAERDGIAHALRRREVSPPGRFLGDTNLEWWWEPLVLRRSIAGVLTHEMMPPPAAGRPEAMPPIVFREWPDSKAFLFRNPRYAVTLSFARKPLATFTPISADSSASPYMTLPVAQGILPEGTTGAAVLGWFGPSGDIPACTLVGKDTGAGAWLVALPEAALWLGGGDFGPLGIENDTLTSPGRTLSGDEWTTQIPAMSPRGAVRLKGNWVCVDNRLGLVSSEPGFEYAPSGGFTQRSVAIDRIRPLRASAWLMLPDCSTTETARIAAGFRVTRSARGVEARLPASGRDMEYLVTAADAQNAHAGATDRPPGISVSVTRRSR